MVIKDITKIKTIDELMERSQWLVGKTLIEIVSEINQSDLHSRVSTKAGVGHAIEKGFFGIEANSVAACDIPHLGVEIKTCPLKITSHGTNLTVKEPLSLNIINYNKEHLHDKIEESSLYAKNKKILFVFYIHDKDIPRSEYLIKYVFLWEMDNAVCAELQPDYIKIIEKIRSGNAHNIHQSDHNSLTLCPKHGGTFRDPLDRKSKTTQPFRDEPAEIRAYRLKNSYMNKIICRHYNLKCGKGGWLIA